MKYLQHFQDECSRPDSRCLIPDDCPPNDALFCGQGSGIRHRESGEVSSLNTLAKNAVILLLLLLPVSVFAAPPGQVTERIHVDQFGYQPEMVKVAVISDPQQGFNETEAYTPGATLQVRKVSNNDLVFSGAVTAWKSGATHDQSGDKIWWFDFSNVTCPGSYYLYDPTTDKRSYAFDISLNAYKEVLKQAARMFYYQRCGVVKSEPFANFKWTDTVCHARTTQDAKCRLISATGDASTEKDLTGGWHDAGDYNKYVNFTTGPLSDLLFAYQNNPGIWTDDFGLPESGNGVPDLLDEIRVELDWLLKMQNNDGSVLSKVSVTQFQATSPASADSSARYYGAASTSSSLSAAASWAHAAIVFSAINPTYAATLRNAAVKAWDWADAKPTVIFTNVGFQSANSEVNDYARRMYKVMAATYLFGLTQEARFQSHVEGNYTQAQPLQWTYWYPYESTLQDALLYYTSLSGVSAGVATAIRTNKQNSIGGGDFLTAFNNETDAYRAYLKNGDYTWGSNQVKSQVGMIFYSQLLYGLDTSKAAIYKTAGDGFVHYLHGVNPLGFVHLSNMQSFGAERSANEMYHAWFGDGTEFDNAQTSPKGPPPGYVMGGANKNYAPDAAYTGPAISPPQNQPVQKSYKDWNTSWPQNSWSISEPAIYYQAAYLKLVATAIKQHSGSRVSEGTCGRSNGGRRGTSR